MGSQVSGGCPADQQSRRGQILGGSGPPDEKPAHQGLSLGSCVAPYTIDTRPAFEWQTATFTADERTQLAAMFSLSSEELSTVLQSCVFALEQFTYNVSKPNVVGAALTKAGFTEEHVRLRRELTSCPVSACLLKH